MSDQPLMGIPASAKSEAEQKPPPGVGFGDGLTHLSRPADGD